MTKKELIIKLQKEYPLKGLVRMSKSVQRAYNCYAKDELEIIEEMLKKGYPPEIFFDRTNAVHSLVRMYYNGVDLESYPGLGVNSEDLLKNKPSSFLGKYTEMIENSINLGIDQFMFKTYGIRIDLYLLNLLYKALVEGYNYTRDFDYSKVPFNECVSYVCARMKGFSKGVSFKYLRFVEPEYQGVTYNLLEEGNQEDILNVLKYDDIYYTSLKISYIKLCMRYNLDMLEYLDILHTPRYKEALTLIGLSEGKFIPKTNTPYIEYLMDYVNLDGFKEFYNEHRYGSNSHLYTKCALYEACKISGANIKEYINYVSKLNTAMLLCIALGEDVSFYLSLNLSGTELKDVITAIQNTRPETKEVINKLIFTKIL